MAVEHIRLGGVRDAADVRVPEGLAVRRVEGDQVAAEIALEEQFAGSGQDTVETAATAGTRVLMAPDDLCGFRIDGGEISAERAQTALFLAAEAHGAARIGLGEIVHGVAVLLRHIEEAGIRRVSRRRPIRNSAVRGGNERAGDVEVLRGIAYGLSFG